MTKYLVVSDSSSLIIAAKTGLLNALCSEFLVQIPEKVFDEAVTAGKLRQKIDALTIDEAIEEKKLVVIKTKPGKADKIHKMLEKLNMDEGEREALQLYFAQNADLLLVDDRQAINAAKLLGAKWATIPDIIVGFAQTGKITRKIAFESLKIAEREGRYKIEIMITAMEKIENIMEENK